MGLWSALTNDKTYNFEQAFGVKDITSAKMQNAINEWFELYFDADGCNEKEDKSQRLPTLVVNKLYKTVFSEYDVAVKSVFLSRCMVNLERQRKRAIQMCFIGGECLLKPVPAGNAFIFVPIRRDCFIPLGRDNDGRLTSVGTAEITVQNKWYYTLLERRTVDGYGTLTIESKLYRSDTNKNIGSQVPLSSLEKYDSLKETITLPGVWNLGIASLRTPMENTVDGSMDAVSVYASATKLIRNININEQQINNEFENGKSRIIVSADMMQIDSKGRRRLEDSVFQSVDESPDDIGITIFSPALRESSYLARKQEYLRNIESLIGLKRGLLSEVEAVERTATEITSSVGDYALTIQDFQQSWMDMLNELLPTCLTLGKLYKLCGDETFDPEKDLSVDWGNGILYDKDKTWEEIMSMVASGMLKPEIAIAWKYDEPWESPEDLVRIREKYMPDIETLAGEA